MQFLQSPHRAQPIRDLWVAASQELRERPWVSVGGRSAVEDDTGSTSWMIVLEVFNRGESLLGCICNRPRRGRAADLQWRDARSACDPPSDVSRRHRAVRNTRL